MVGSLHFLVQQRRARGFAGFPLPASVTNEDAPCACAHPVITGLFARLRDNRDTHPPAKRREEKRKERKKRGCSQRTLFSTGTAADPPVRTPRRAPATPPATLLRSIHRRDPNSLPRSLYHQDGRHRRIPNHPARRLRRGRRESNFKPQNAGWPGRRTRVAIRFSAFGVPPAPVLTPPHQRVDSWLGTENTCQSEYLDFSKLAGRHRVTFFPGFPATVL